MILKHIIRKSKKFIKYQTRIPSAYYACTFVSPSCSHEQFVSSRCSQYLFRPMATSSRDEQDIDLITMKLIPKAKGKGNSKNKVNLVNDDAALNIIPTVNFIQESKIEGEKLDNLLYKQFIKLTIYSDPEHELAEKLGGSDAESKLDFVNKYYQELWDFEEFLQGTHKSKKMKIGDLNSLETLNGLEQFQSFYSKYQEVNENKVDKYREMQKEFVKFLENDSAFPSLLTKELIPIIKNYHKLRIFFGNSLQWFGKELESLDKEFNFKKFRSTKDLTAQIDKTLGRCEDFLSNNTQANETVFQVLVQCARYDVLNSVFRELGDLNLKDIKKIIKDPNYQSYVDTVFLENSGSHSSGPPALNYELKQAGGLYHFLLSTDLVPRTDYFYTLAPMLYNISKEKSLYGKAAGQLLRILTNQEVAQTIDISECITSEHYFEIYDISKDKLTNYIFSFLLLIDFPWEKARIHRNWNIKFDTCWDPPSNNQYLYDIIVSNQDHIRKMFSDPNVTVSYMCLRGSPLSDCIPSTSDIWQDIELIRDIRDTLGISFASFGSVSYLTDRINELGPEYDDVCSHIVDASRYFGNQLCVLDQIVEKLEEEEYKEEIKALETLVRNIEEFLPYTTELEIFYNIKGGFDDKDYVINELNNMIEDIVSEDISFPGVTTEEFLAFQDKIISFSNGKSNDCLEFLDDVVDGKHRDIIEMLEVHSAEEVIADQSQVIADAYQVNEAIVKVAAREDKENAADQYTEKLTGENETSTPYVQIPDDLDLHNFTKELITLKSVLGRPFSHSSDEEILNVLENEIDNFFTSSGTRSSLLASNHSDVFNFLRLKRKLHRLFDINGGNTEVLDVVLNSQAVFESFESSKAPVEYKQIPNDFNLEEYYLELNELKKNLGISKFEEVKANQILSKIQELSDDKSNGVEKNLLWGKLYRNLSMLFRHNNGTTSALDNVISSAQEYLRFECNRAQEKKPKSPIALQAELLTGNEHEVLGEFLRFSDLLYRSDVHKIGPEEFKNMIDRFEESLDKSSSTYLFTKNVLDQLNKFNYEIEFYPPFLVCIYGTNYFGEFPMSSYQLEAFYDDLVRSLNDIIEEEAVIAKQDTSSSKFNLDDFTSQIKPETKYNDSERIISDLDKETSAADFEAIKLAVDSAFEEPPKSIVTPEIVEPKQEIKPKKKIVKHLDTTSSSSATPEIVEPKQEIKPKKKIVKHLDTTSSSSATPEIVEPKQEIKPKKKIVKHLDTTSSSSATPEIVEPKPESKPKKKIVKHLDTTSSSSANEVDRSKLEKYLKKAKRQEESKMREKEAYEWSKKADFDVKRAKITSKYCILTLEGDLVPISQRVFDDLPKEDIFKTLNKFTKEEIAKATEIVEDLQSKNWKVVGSRIEGGKKYLVLVNNDTTGRAYRVIRGLLATTGLVVLTVLGINLWVDESDQFNKAIAEYEKKEDKKDNNTSGPFSVSRAPTPELVAPTIFGKEKIIGVFESQEKKSVQVEQQQQQEEEESNQLSWWQRLLWTK